MRMTPKEFLRRRRPEKFSDSDVITEISTNRSQLEYYLETLTSRKEETEFESFAKRLCEVEICPNLLPQTGPTGGGDSKVDSETYPVSEDTTLNWYVGFGDKAEKDRWGFAFSTKEDWATKARSDIKKMHSTERGYKVAYFVTSRFVKDSRRAEIETELSKETGMDVRILDRTWILDNVFSKNRERIIRETLNIELIEQPKVKIGPLDQKRIERLKDIDEKIEDAVSKKDVSLNIVDQAVRSAILSRELERDRSEVDGRFSRAIRIADEHGNVYQQFEAVYQMAWTTFWWHEDFGTFLNIYPSVEKLALGKQNISHLERLTNLWNLLLIIKRNVGIDEELLTKYTASLQKALEEMAAKESFPSASLQAKSLLLHMELLQKISSGEDLGKTLTALQQVVTDSKGLIGFPFNTLVQILTENSEQLEKYPQYNDLFETILKVSKERDGELAEAKLLLARGEKFIELKQYYEAIQVIGRATKDLHKEESRDELVRALYLAGIAYYEVGLFWAARGSFLSAASLATGDFWDHGEINIMQALCFSRMKWIELRLGRIAQALDWHWVDYAFRQQLQKQGYEDLFGEINEFDIALGILFLLADIPTLRNLELLPDVLPEYGLEYSDTALVYALQGKEALPKEVVDAIGAQEIESFFEQWVRKHSPKHLPEKLLNTEEDKVEYRSRILGCSVTIATDNKEPFIEIAESVLAAIEGFLATLPLRRAMAKESVLKIQIIHSNDGTELIEHTVDNEGDCPVITIKAKEFNPHVVPKADQSKITDSIFKILVDATALVVMFKDTEKDLEDIFGTERSPERALNFTSSFITLGNVLGHKPRFKVSDLIGADQKRYEYKRTEPLHLEVPAEEKPDSVEPPDKEAFTHASHADMEMLSVIRMGQWDEAKWQGVGYASSDQPPILCIAFANGDVAKKIMEGWKNKFGDEDENEEIRVTIVEDISEANPTYYTVGIGTNIEAQKKKSGGTRYFASVTRSHTMTPATTENLERFKKEYQKYGCYWLAVGACDRAGGNFKIDFDHMLFKREIHFRKRKDIGENDQDRTIMFGEEDK